MKVIDTTCADCYVGGWLRGIVRNVCLRRLRERRRGEIPFEEELPWRVVLSGFSEPSVEEAIDRLAMREWVWTALGELPEELQVTAVLRYFGSNCSYEEISAILGVPLGTVKSRLNTVKLRLAEALLRAAELEHDETRRLGAARADFDLESPPDDPHHCPPALSQVAVYRDGRIHRMHWFLAPRPVREGYWEETIPQSTAG